VTNWVTCWGGGAVNARRADERALKLAASPPLTTLDITRILQARAALLAPMPGGVTGPITSPVPNAPADAAARLFGGGQLGQSRAGGNVGRLTAASACHSVWIVASSDRRSWYHLAVLDETDPQHPRSYSSQW
jgi:hypothetical protein